jgi:hypothetical protein
MGKHSWMAALIVACLAFAPGARAEEDEFAGLMPGKPLPEEEMSSYFGAALVNFTAMDGSVVTNQGSIDTSSLNSLGSSNISGGIFMPTQFTGDYNNVSTVVNIEVHLNTVNISDSAGSSVSVNQSLDFGGGVVGGFIQ